jgi:hypothetical protein
MSEELTERLSRFTPDGGALDRDAVLFAAGRASAHPNCRWLALAGTLAASQLLTLVLLWPRPAAPDVAPVAKSAPPAVAPAPPQEPAPQPPDGTLASWGLTDLPPLRPVTDLRPDAPPLRACLALYDELPF